MDNDCFSCIFGYLGVIEICTLLTICKQLNSVANSELLWKSLCDDKFNNFRIVDNYKTKYIQLSYLNTFLMKIVKKSADEVYNSKTLFLGNNQLESIPFEIGFLTNLQTLSLNCNQLKSIPFEIGFLTNLQNLYLSDNQLESIPNELGLLTNLQNLWLGNNRLEFIPNELRHLTNLQYLSLNNNQLESIPNALGQLVGLRIVGFH